MRGRRKEGPRTVAAPFAGEISDIMGLRCKGLFRQSEGKLFSTNGLSCRTLKDKPHIQMIDLQVYAPGLREGDHVVRLGHILETRPHVRYKVDANHDMVYFEFDGPNMTLREIRQAFEDLGLRPRLVGIIPEELEERAKTRKLT